MVISLRWGGAGHLYTSRVSGFRLQYGGYYIGVGYYKVVDFISSTI